jgi:hypothetical protein
MSGSVKGRKSPGSGPRHHCHEPDHEWKGIPHTKGSICLTCRRARERARGYATRRLRGLKKASPCVDPSHVHAPGGCRTCKASWAREHAPYSTVAHRERTYGLTHQEQLAVFESSDGLCALCYAVPATHIDHDHVTGRVRGALCTSCNLKLGSLESEWASMAHEYLALTDESMVA